MYYWFATALPLLTVVIMIVLTSLWNLMNADSAALKYNILMTKKELD